MEQAFPVNLDAQLRIALEGSILPSSAAIPDIDECDALTVINYQMPQGMGHAPDENCTPAIGDTAIPWGGVPWSGVDACQAATDRLAIDWWDQDPVRVHEDDARVREQDGGTRVEWALVDPMHDSDEGRRNRVRLEGIVHMFLANGNLALGGGGGGGARAGGDSSNSGTSGEVGMDVGRVGSDAGGKRRRVH